MGLLRNNRSDGGGPLTLVGGGVAFTTTRLAQSSGDLMGWYSRHETYSGIPDGSRPGESFLAPLDGGGLAADLRAAASMAGEVLGIGVVEAAIAGLATVAAAADRGVQLSSSMAGSSSLAAGISAIGNLLAAIRVNQVTQTDIESAVMSATVEGGLSLREVLRVLLAVAAGKTTITGSNVAFRDQADTKARVAASMTASQRTTVTIDPT